MEASDHKSDNNVAAKDLVKKAAFHPGFIRYACMRDGGSYSGAMLETFTDMEGGGVSLSAVTQCNKFFAEHQNYTVLDIWVRDGEVTVLYTNFMDEEELQDFNEAAEELRGIMGRKREERRKAELESMNAEEKEAAERTRLIEVGRKCESNHKKEKKAKR